MKELTLDVGQKYGLIALPSANLSQALPQQEQLTSDLSISRIPPFSLSSNWRKWIGTVKAEQFEKADLFLLAKGPSSAPELLDSDNEKYKNKVLAFFSGIIISGFLPSEGSPFLLTGANVNGEVTVRQVGDLPQPHLIAGLKRIEIDPLRLTKAAQIADVIPKLETATDKFTRLRRSINAFNAASLPITHLTVSISSFAP